jgi:hypothetical protein
MSRPDGQCSCINDLGQLQIADTFAEEVACHFVDTMGGTCPEMMDYVVERVIARLVHVAVWNHDETLEHSERKTLDATAEYLFRLSKTTPAALKIIMDESARSKEPSNARN